LFFINLNCFVVILHINQEVVDTFFKKIPVKWGYRSKKCQLANQGCRFIEYNSTYGEKQLLYSTHFTVTGYL